MPTETSDRANSNRSLWHRSESAAWGLGILLVMLWGGLQVRAEAARATAVAAFATAGQQTAGDDEIEIDFSLWAKGRIAAWEKHLGSDVGPTLGVLRIPKLHLAVPIYGGTDDITLDLGTGHHWASSLPGEGGNIAIAGHRDGYFRGLKDIQKGDRMEVETTDFTEIYVIDEITITTPEDLSVLDPTPKPALTLIACYPFYFVGNAPKRYIVRGTLLETVPRSGDGT